MEFLRITLLHISQQASKRNAMIGSYATNNASFALLLLATRYVGLLKKTCFKYQ